MSTIRYFNDVPHIVRYGMKDEDKKRSWILFWKNGIRFDINVEGSDIRGTAFEKKWLDLIKEPPVRGVHLKRWNQFCDLMILQSMNLLDELAPNHQHWITLQDYLRTPSYRLRMVSDPDSGDAKAEFVSGPEVKPAYELDPIPADELGQFPPELLQYSSDKITVIEREADWRRPPSVVLTPEGQPYELLRIERSSSSVTTGIVMRDSVDKAQGYMRMHEKYRNRPEEYPDRIPRLVGYITEAKEATTSMKTSQLDNVPANTTPTTSQTLIAGLLLTLFPGSRSLWDTIRDQKTDPALTHYINKNSQTWKSQILSILQTFHKKDMYWGDHCNDNDDDDDDNKYNKPETATMPSYNISQHTIYTDESNQIWLSPLKYHQIHPTDDKIAAKLFIVGDDDIDDLIRNKNKSNDDNNKDIADAIATRIDDGDTGGTSTDTKRRQKLEKGKAIDIEAVEYLFETWLPKEMEKV